MKKISLLLRLGLAFSFIYVAISSFLNPSSWIGFFPGFLQKDNILTAFSVYEIILGIWILSGKKLFYSSILAGLTLFGIIISNFGAFDIVFRDITILFMAIALALLSRDNKQGL